MQISLDTICEKLFDISSGLPVSASAVNAVHACRDGHPFGKGKSKYDLYISAAMALEPHLGINSLEVNWLIEQAGT